MRRNIGYALLAASLFGFGFAFVGAANAQIAEERKPEFGFSIANIRSGAVRNGPLFQKAKLAIDAANQGNGSSFERYLVPKAELTLSALTQSDISKTLLSVETIQAISKSCLGPYSGDEGSSWIQFSWVCHVNKEYPLAKFLAFRESPELTFTIWFKDNLISKIQAIEPIPVPGRRLITMDAAETMQAKQ